MLLSNVRWLCRLPFPCVWHTFHRNSCWTPRGKRSQDFPDLIYVERWRALQHVPAGVQVPVVCDPTDSMLLYNQRLVRAGRWWERMVGLEESIKFRQYEAALARRAGAQLFFASASRYWMP